MVHRHLSSFSQMRYQPRLLEPIIFLLVKYVMYIYADMFFLFFFPSVKEKNYRSQTPDEPGSP